MRSRKGILEVICGSMFSGKSEELIRRVRRAQIAKLKVQVFKPSVDNRFGVNTVTSHDGTSQTAVPVGHPQDILELVENDTDVVAIDEIQFFAPEITGVCNRLANRGFRVIAAGLDMDFRGEPFGPMPALLAVAETVDKLRAICLVCGSEASRSQRIIDGKPADYDSPTVMIGACESYEARCRHCHDTAMQRPSIYQEKELALSYDNSK